MLALRLALRDLRGGVSGLRVVIACLALGVTSIAAVGTLRAGIEDGLARDGTRILGGTIEIEGGAQPLPDTLRAWLTERGARLSDVVTTRSMLVAPSGERQLIDLKAVDSAWPLVGAAGFAPAMTPATAFRDHGLVAPQVVLDRLKVHAGDTVRIGSATVRIAATLTDEPDGATSPAFIAPRALTGSDTLRAADLLRPGAFAEYRLRALLPSGRDVPRLEADLKAAFPNTGWRLRDAHDAAPGVTQFIDRTGLFMTFVGLTALLVGGIGVANGVRAWLDAKARMIATLRCLGAAPRLVLTVCAIEVALLAAFGIGVGVVAGAALPVLATHAFADLLPFPPIDGVQPAALALASAFGALTALGFALWPLARAARIPGGALFRDALLPARVRLGGRMLAANLVAVAALVGLVVATAESWRFAAGFCVAAAGTLVLFRAGGSALVAAARAVRPRRVWTRLGLGNLHRPGHATPLMLVSLGLGLSTLAAVALIEANARRQIDEQLPKAAPSFFFIDIQNDQLDQFRQIVHATPGTSDLRDVPSLRARMVAVHGVPADQVRATPETAWALRGDRGLTLAAAEPDGTRLVAGSWWPADYSGKPLVSFDANLARGWGVKVGDTLRVNVLGRDLDLTVASLRDVAWRSLGLNFTLVASPGLLDRAPHMNIATVRAEPPAQAGLLRAVTDALPNVSGIRVADVLDAIASLLGKLAAALTATGSLTLVAGALVLAGAVASGQRRRVREAVILKTLGATRAQIRAAWLVEFGTLGLAAGLVAAAVGTAASWGVTRFVMASDWSFLPGTLIVVVVACMASMVVFGYLGTEAALRTKAAPLLRVD